MSVFYKIKYIFPAAVKFSAWYLFIYQRIIINTFTSERYTLPSDVKGNFSP